MIINNVHISVMGKYMRSNCDLHVCKDSELKPSLPLLLSNMAEPRPGETQTSIIIEQEDGTEKHIVLSTPQIATGDTASTGECLLIYYLLWIQYCV